MSFTPGPWWVEVFTHYTNVESKHQTICSEVSNCDADIIAAAPDMYEAIKLAMSRHRVYSGNLEVPIEALYAFEKALAKAEGK